MSSNKETGAYGAAANITITIVNIAEEIDGVEMLPGGAKTRALVGITADVLGQSSDGFDAKDGFEVAGSFISGASIGYVAGGLMVASGVGTIPAILIGGGVSLFSGKPGEIAGGMLYEWFNGTGAGTTDYTTDNDNNGVPDNVPSTVSSNSDGTYKRAASNLSTPIPYKNKNRASSLERRVFGS